MEIHLLNGCLSIVMLVFRGVSSKMTCYYHLDYHYIEAPYPLGASRCGLLLDCYPRLLNQKNMAKWLFQLLMKENSAKQLI